MSPSEAERGFLSTVSEYLLSLPFDLKILQEAASDPDLDKSARELAAGAVMHTLLPQEGEGLLRFVDDVLFVRAAFAEVEKRGGEGFPGFRDRFREVYERLAADQALFERQLGAELWRWLSAKVQTFPRATFKGKKAEQYIASEENLALLYDEGLEFETNYNVTAEQVKNKLRRSEQIVDLLNKRHSEDARRIGSAS